MKTVHTHNPALNQGGTEEINGGTVGSGRRETILSFPHVMIVFLLSERQGKGEMTLGQREGNEKRVPLPPTISSSPPASPSHSCRVQKLSFPLPFWWLISPSPTTDRPHLSPPFTHFFFPSFLLSFYNGFQCCEFLCRSWLFWLLLLLWPSRGGTERLSLLNTLSLDTLADCQAVFVTAGERIRGWMGIRDHKIPLTGPRSLLRSRGGGTHRKLRNRQWWSLCGNVRGHWYKVWSPLPVRMHCEWFTLTYSLFASN